MGPGSNQRVSVAISEVEGVAIESTEVEAAHQGTADRVGGVAAAGTVKKPAALAGGAADPDAYDGSGGRVAGAVVLTVPGRPEGLIELAELPYGVQTAAVTHRSAGLVDVDVAGFADAASCAWLSADGAGEVVAGWSAWRCAEVKIAIRPTDIRLICQTGNR